MNGLGSTILGSAIEVELSDLGGVSEAAASDVVGNGPNSRRWLVSPSTWRVRKFFITWEADREMGI